MRIQLGIPMSLAEIAFATGGKVNCPKNPIIEYISTDSREVKPNDLFIALKGNGTDGLVFTKEVKKIGGYALSYDAENCDILHPDGASALLDLASYYNKNLPYILYRIGITGSVGKTTTKEFLKMLLSESFVTHASKGNFNNHIGMPMSILSAKKESQILIMEMGMNHTGEIKILSECLQPNIGIITNVGTAHIGNLLTRKNIAEAKLEITVGMKNGMLFIPEDEPLLQCDMKKRSFSASNPEANYSIKKDENNRISLYKNRNLYTEAIFNLPEKHHLKCLITASSVAMEIGIPAEELSRQISSISEENIRQKIIYREKLYFYADFYNASRESVLALIKGAESNAEQVNKSLLLGDILELGEMNRSIHHEIGRSISPLVFNKLFLFGDSVKYVALGAIENGFPRDRIFLNENLSNPQASAEYIRKLCVEGEAIYMKASRAVRLERIMNCFGE